MSRFWVQVAASGTGNWSDTAHWSITSGGAGGAAVPTSSDDVFFDINSFSGAGQTVTIDSPSTCRDMICTGLTNSPVLAGSSTLTISGSLDLTGMGTPTCTGQWTFNASTTGKTVKTASLTLPMFLVFDDAGLGGGWTLQDGMVATKATSTMRIWGGTFSWGTGFTHSFAGEVNIRAGLSLIQPVDIFFNDCLIINSGSNANVLTLVPVGPINIHSNTAIFRMSGAAPILGTGTLTSIDTGGLSVEWNPTANGQLVVGDWLNMGHITIASTAVSSEFSVAHNGISCSGAFTVNGQTISKRVLIDSQTAGSSRTITAGSWSLTNVDFADIVPVGGIWPADVSTIGNIGGNSGLFIGRPSQTFFWFKDTGSFSDTTKWYTATNGLGAASTIPLPQDTAKFDVNSFSIGSQTITFDVFRRGGEDWTGATNTPTRALSLSQNTYGSVTQISAMTLSGGFTLTFAGRGANTFTSAGKSASGGIQCDCVNGSVTQQDNLTITVNFNFVLRSGTYDGSGRTITLSGVGTLGADGVLTARTLIMWATVILASTGTVWHVAGPGLAISPGTSVIRLTGTSATSRTFAGGGFTYYDLVDTNTGGAALILTGNNSFNSINSNGSSRTVTMPANGTQTITSPSGFFPSARPDRKVTFVSSTPGTQWNLISSNGYRQVTSYISLTDSHADTSGLWFAGNQSTNVSNNTNWTFQIARHQTINRIAAPS